MEASSAMPTQSPETPPGRFPEEMRRTPGLRPLTALTPGEQGIVYANSIASQDRDLLAALGLVDRSTVLLCKAGNPWIVQVRGTRIGLSEELARQLQVADAAA